MPSKNPTGGDRDGSEADPDSDSIAPGKQNHNPPSKKPNEPTPDLNGAGELLQRSLQLLIAEKYAEAVAVAGQAMERIIKANDTATKGWSVWLEGMSQLYLNNPEAALTSLKQAYELGLEAKQANLVLAANLGMQLLNSYQHYRDLRRQLENQEVLLAQQFRAATTLATQTLSTLTGETLPASATPEAQTQLIAAVSNPQEGPRLPRMEVRLFGEFQVVRGGEPVNFKAHRKPADIFKFLLMHRERSVPTDTLLYNIWPNVETGKGMHRLHLNISTLRGMLNPANLDKKQDGYILTAPNSYYLSPAAVFETDVDHFNSHFRHAQAHLKSGKHDLSVPHLEAGVALYRDDYLAENVFDDWTATGRAHLRKNYISMLAGLSEYYLIARRYDDALNAARKMLDKDEFREDAHRFMMYSLVGLDQRNQALLHYQQLVHFMFTELGADPSPDTMRLYNRIKNNESVLDFI